MWAATNRNNTTFTCSMPHLKVAFGGAIALGHSAIPLQPGVRIARAVRGGASLTLTGVITAVKGTDVLTTAQMYLYKESMETFFKNGNDKFAVRVDTQGLYFENCACDSITFSEDRTSYLVFDYAVTFTVPSGLVDGKIT